MNSSDHQQFCPSIDELTAFSIGRLPEPTLNRVAAHIEIPCPKCVAVLGQLEDSADPLLADLREPFPLSAAEAEEAYRSVLELVLGPAVLTTDWDPPWSPSNATAIDKAP